MARNLLSDLPVEALYRVDVSFDITEMNLDSLTGRKAHLELVENRDLMQMLIMRYRDFFS